MPVLPELRVAGGVREAFELAQGFSQLFGLLLLADDQVAEGVLLQERRGERVVTEASAALPAHALCNAAEIGAVDELRETGDDVGVAVVPDLHHDPATTHLVSDGTGCSRTGE